MITTVSIHCLFLQHLVFVQVCAGNIPEPPLGEAPGADPLHAALQVEQCCDGLFQTLFILVILTLLLQLLWKQGGVKGVSQSHLTDDITCRDR